MVYGVRHKNVIFRSSIELTFKLYIELLKEGKNVSIVKGW